MIVKLFNLLLKSIHKSPYWYDAWGNQQVLDATGNAITDTTNVGILNPFRYRSYYFDTETGLYYLQTSYYDPEVGRFLNIDSLDYADPETINGLNLFAYCDNNPVMNSDPEGTFVSTILGGIFGAIWGAVGALMSGENLDGVLKSAAIGAATGALAGAALDVAVATGGVGGVLLAGLGGFAASMAGDVATQLIVEERSEIDWGRAAISGAIGGVTNLMGFGVSKIAEQALGKAIPKSAGRLLKRVAMSLKPEFTPPSSWLFQGIATWTLPFFGLIPSLAELK